MCYAQPGPRCEAHAKEKYQALKVKSDNKLVKLNDAQKAVEDYKKANPDSYENSKKHANLRKKSETLWTEHIYAEAQTRKARKEMDATSGGLQTLKSELRIYAEDPTGTDTAERIKLQQRIAVGEKTYNKKMMEFDTVNGTVNGRKPSPYGSPEGLKMLQKPVQKANDEYKKAITGEEKKAAMEKHKAAKKSLEHAKLTYERVKQGKVDPDKASYRENRAKYKDITKRHAMAGQKLQDKLRQSLTADGSVPEEVHLAEQEKARDEYMKVNEEKIACEAKLTRAEMGKY